jgi:hypothetical protein
LEVSDLAREKSWRERVKAALAGHRLASLVRQRADCCGRHAGIAPRIALNDASIVDTKWFQRRAHRALCQDDGVVNRGEDYVRQFRWKIDGG